MNEINIEEKKEINNENKKDMETKEEKEEKENKSEKDELQDNAKIEKDDKDSKKEKKEKNEKNEKEGTEKKEKKEENKENNISQINKEKEIKQQNNNEKNQNVNKSTNEKTEIIDKETINRIKLLFESINNFDQLKNEVCEMKKHYEYLNQLTLKTLEEKEQVKNNINKFALQFSELNKKFEALMGNPQHQEQSENGQSENQLPEKENSDNNNKPKVMNLLEMNSLLKTFEYSKANLTDLSQINDDLDGKVKELSDKIDHLKLSLFGVEKDEKTNTKNKNNKNQKIDDDNSKNSINVQRFNFLNKADFEKFKTKTEEEHNKMWKEIDSLRLVVGDMNDNFNNKASLDDLEELKNIILDKTEELFLSQNKKNNNFSSAIKILQENFKKLLKLLSEKEQNNNFQGQFQHQFENKRSGSGGNSCASCEKYIGELKTEPKFVNWNKFPQKGKNNADILKRVQNGYSRLLQMINFDNNGYPTLMPYTSNINSDTNISSNIEDNISQTKDNNKEVNQSMLNKRIFSSKIKKILQENNTTLDYINSKKDEAFIRKKLPTIKTSKSIDNFRNLKLKSNQTSSSKEIYYINPALYKGSQKSEEKNG